MNARSGPLARPVFVLAAVLAASCTACGGRKLPQPEEGASVDGGTDGEPVVPPTDSEDALPADVVVDTTSPGRDIDPRLFGSNLPAWLGPDRLSDPLFQDMTVASGVSLLRMPGGSWSNSYDWSGCEQRTAGCVFPKAARPSDFIGFMDDTGLPGMWTLSVNQTAESAAAAVAFFNGAVDDERVIGTDRAGVDWGTVGTWARLRAAGGHDDAHPIELWEVGNEVYGGRPESGGAACASFGWEDVWTCDGATYVNGDATHDGYLTIREQMLLVDPDIEVGAVGVGDPAGWGGWGEEVIAAAGAQLDFYVIHEYGFDESPDGVSAIHRPRDLWPGVIDEARDALNGIAPVAVTEYNLVSVEVADEDRTMTEAMNVLYLADTIGQLAEAEVSIANQWNLANGTASNGTDYGMIDLGDLSPRPQYTAMAMWATAGDELLDATYDDETLRVYPTRHPDGSVTIVAISLDSEPRIVRFALEGWTDGGTASVSSAATVELDSTELTVGEQTSVVDDEGVFEAEIAGWSVSTIGIG